MKANNLIPRVCVSCPTSDRHKHLLNEWIKSLDDLTYPVDVCLVDTSQNEDYFKLLKTKKVQGKKIKVLRHKWNQDKKHPLQMLANAREKIRRYFLENKYDYLFFLDSDIFIPKNSVQLLLSHNKDNVGFYVHIFHEQKVPCILKSGEIIMGGGMEFFSFDEINEYKSFVKKYKNNKLTKKEENLIPFIIKDKFKPYLLNAYGVNLGCLLIKKAVLEKVEFRTHDSLILGEDIWYFAEANEKGFEFWCNTDIQARHENTEWDSLINKSKKKMGFTLIHGPSNAKETVILK